MQLSESTIDIAPRLLPVDPQETVSFVFQGHCPSKLCGFVRSLEGIGFSCHSLEFWGEAENGQEFEGLLVQSVSEESIKVDGQWISPANGDYALNIIVPHWLSLI